MSLRLSPLVYCCLAFCAAVASVATVRAAEEVEVGQVRFNTLRAPNGPPGNWLEAEVALDVRPPPSLSRMVARVRVILTLGFELPAPAGGERRIEFYRAEAECVALETGRSGVRFYLPWELVKRDQLHGDPKFWGIELAVGGKTVPAARGSYSASLAPPETRKNFQTRATTAATVNDGLLQPQYLTPFAHEYLRTTPSFVRRESR